MLLKLSRWVGACFSALFGIRICKVTSWVTPDLQGTPSTGEQANANSNVVNDWCYMEQTESPIWKRFSRARARDSARECRSPRRPVGVVRDVCATHLGRNGEGGVCDVADNNRNTNRNALRQEERRIGRIPYTVQQRVSLSWFAFGLVSCFAMTDTALSTHP